MNLIIIATFVAVCGGDKLDRTYLPPPSAKASGGSPGSLQAPFAGNSFNQGLGGLPKGSFTNEFQGVVVDAASAGTRASDGETGLGAPRISYGSTNSKVGDAAFRGVAGFKQVNPQFNQGTDSDVQAANQVTGFSQAAAGAIDNKPERAQAPYDRVANTVRFENVVDTDSYHYAFETDNGISAEENGVAVNGVQSQGGYSYTGDDGQVYSVTYTADEGGYQPKGDHLPTPPPIPEEILKSLEQNARDEAAGLIDDGSYDSQKYNAGGDYAENDVTREEQYDRPSSNFGRRPESDATASSTFINQNNQPFARPNPNLIQENSQSNSVQPSDTANLNIQTTQMNRQQQQNGMRNPNRFGFTGAGITSNDRQLQTSTGSNNPQFTGVNDNNTPPTENVAGSGQGSRFSEYESSQPFERPSSDKLNPQSSNQKLSNQFDMSQNRVISASMPNGVIRGPNTFGSRKEYLPPSSSQNVFSQKPVTSQVSKATASFLSTGQSTIPSQSDFLNSNPEQGKPILNNYQQNSQMLDGQNIDRFPQKSEKIEDNGPFSSSLSPQRPTSVPSIELTTPFESNEQQSQSITKIPSSFYNTQILNVRPMTQFGFQSNREPSFRPHTSISQQIDSGAAYQQPQSVQSGFNQFQSDDAQLAPSTVRPTFNQQVPDQSYYYKQPAKPLNIPTTPESRFPSAASGQFNRVNQRPSSAQFPNVPQNTAISNSFYQAQREQNRGSTRYPQPPTLAPTAPTSSSQFLGSTSASQFNGMTQASASPFRQQNQGSTRYPKPPTVAPTAPTTPVRGFSQQVKYSGITQATASSFSSSLPTASANFISQSPIASRPALQSNQYNKQSQFQTPISQSFGQASFPDAQHQDSSIIKDQDQTPGPVPSQQYSGQIYEYTKPSEKLPAPHKTESTSALQQDRSVSQLGSTQPARPSFVAKPEPGPQPSSTQFNGQDQLGHDSASQYNVQPPFGSKPQASFVTGSQTNTQNNKRPNCCQSLNSKISRLESQKPTGNDQSGPFGSQFPGSSSQTSSYAGKGEVFSGHRKPPSFDQETGYHY